MQYTPGQCIYTVLYHYGSVAIQEVGTISTALQPAFIAPSTRLLYPPRQFPNFVPDNNQRHDKHLLDFLSIINGYSKVRAKIILDGFSLDIIGMLRQGEPVYIPHLGMLLPKNKAENLPLRLISLPGDRFKRNYGFPVLPIAVQKKFKLEDNNVIPVVASSLYAIPGEKKPVPPLTPLQRRPRAAGGGHAFFWSVAAYLVLSVVGLIFMGQKHDPVTHQEAARSKALLKEPARLESPEQKDNITIQHATVKKQEPCLIVVGSFVKPSNVETVKDQIEGFNYRSATYRVGSLTAVGFEIDCQADKLDLTLQWARETFDAAAFIKEPGQ